MKDERKRTALGFALAPFAALLVLFIRLIIQQRQPPSIPPLLIALIFMYTVQVILVLPLHLFFQSNGMTSLSPYLAIGALASATPIVFSLPHPTLNLAGLVWQFSMGWAAAFTFWWISVQQTKHPGST